MSEKSHEDNQPLDRPEMDATATDSGPSIKDVTKNLLDRINRHVPCEPAVRESARRMSVPALQRLEQIALHGSEAAAVQAIEVILDRAFGRPHQKVVNVRSGVVVLPEEEIEELRAIDG